MSSECVSDCCVMPREHYFSYIMARTRRSDDNDVRVVLDQYINSIYLEGVVSGVIR
jgi:hypothetical protein